MVNSKNTEEKGEKNSGFLFLFTASIGTESDILPKVYTSALNRFS